MTVENYITLGVALGSGIVSVAVSYGAIRTNIAVMTKEIERIDKQLDSYNKISSDLAEIKGQVNILLSKFLDK